MMNLKFCNTFKWQYLVDMKIILGLELRGGQAYTSGFKM